MFHDTAASQAAHGKSFSVKGVIESSHASELVSAEEFAQLKLSDVKLTRTLGGGIGYELEVFVSVPVAEPEPVAEAPAVESARAPLGALVQQVNETMPVVGEPSLDEQLGESSAT